MSNAEQNIHSISFKTQMTYGSQAVNCGTAIRIMNIFDSVNRLLSGDMR